MTWTEDWMGDRTSIELTHLGHPCPTGVDPERIPDAHQTDTLGTPCPIGMDQEGGLDAHQT